MCIIIGRELSTLSPPSLPFQVSKGLSLSRYSQLTTRHYVCPSWVANSRLLTPISPLECALTSKHRVLPCFGRNCPRVTPLESALTRRRPVTPLECAVPKKVGGGGSSPFPFSSAQYRWKYPSCWPRRTLARNSLDRFPSVRIVALGPSARMRPSRSRTTRSISGMISGT